MKTQIGTLVLLFLSAQTLPAGTDNLIENGSFELGDFQVDVVPALPATGFWSYVPLASGRLQGWSVELSPDDPDGLATTAGLEWTGAAPTKSTFPDGLMMVDLVDGTDFFRLSTSMATSKDKRYRLTFWVQAGGVLGLRLTGNSPRLVQTVPVSEDFTWRQIAFSFTADSAVTRLELWASQVGTVLAGSGPLLDAVRVVPIEEPSVGISMYAGIQIRGTPGRVYRIEYAPGLAPENWQALTNLLLPQTPYLFIDLGSSAEQERFYRSVELP